MKQTDQKYNCNICGSLIEVLYGGEGNLTCCGENMKLVMEQARDANFFKAGTLTDDLMRRNK